MRLGRVPGRAFCRLESRPTPSLSSMAELNSHMIMDEYAEEDEDDFSGSEITPGQKPSADGVNVSLPTGNGKQMVLEAIEDSRRQLGRLERIVAEAQRDMSRWKLQIQDAQEFLKDEEDSDFKVVAKSYEQRDQSEAKKMDHRATTNSRH